MLHDLVATPVAGLHAGNFLADVGRELERCWEVALAADDGRVYEVDDPATKTSRPDDHEAVQIGHLTPQHLGRRPGPEVFVKRTNTAGEF